MTKDEALRLALEALSEAHYVVEHRQDIKKREQAITAIKAALEAKDEPVSVLQKPTSERAWFTIAELNAWADKKLSENPHWVMPKDEPERDDPPPQRTWVGLTDEDKQKLAAEQHDWEGLCSAVEAKLKEKNT